MGFMFQYEVVQEALGGLPPAEYFVDNEAHVNERIMNRVLDVYDECKHRLFPLPEKPAHELRPAFANDYIQIGEKDSRNRREYAFLKRALIYSHGVGILDRLGEWSKLRRQSETDFFGAGLGEAKCPNGVSDILQVIRYAEYEKYGLVHYFQRSGESEINSYLSEAQAALDEMGFGVESLQDLLASQRLSWGLSELFKTLEIVGGSDGRLDLYLPDWTMPDFTLEWLLDKVNHGEPEGFDTEELLGNIGDYLSFRKVLAMPTPGLKDFEELSPEKLNEVRQSKYFRRFRNEIRDISDDFAECGDSNNLRSLDKRGQITRDLDRVHEAFIEDFGRLRFGWGESIGQGLFFGSVSTVSVATYSAIAGQDLLSNSVLGALPFVSTMIATPLFNAARWLLNDKKTVEATALHYRAFMTDRLR